MLTKGAPAARLATLHFLSRHAFFVADTGSKVRAACSSLGLAGCLTYGVHTVSLSKSPSRKCQLSIVMQYSQKTHTISTRACAGIWGL